MSGYSSSSGYRRRPVMGYDPEERALDRITRDAEERMNKKREARDEARQYRLEQLEKQIKATDEANSSAVNGNGNADKLRSQLMREKDECEREHLQDKVSELENKFERAMMLYSQVDNEKSALLYEIDLLKDDMEEKDEIVYQAKREAKNLTTEVKLLQKTIEGLQTTQQQLKQEIQKRDDLIQEHGLCLVDQEDDELTSCSASTTSTDFQPRPGSMLLSLHTVSQIEKAIPGQQTLNEKLKKMVDMNKKLRQQVEETEQILYARRTRQNEYQSYQMNGAAAAEEKETARIAELRLRIQEMEREQTTRQGNYQRIESQLNRFRNQAEQSEKECTELKAQIRGLKKELRDRENTLDEVKETNCHLQSRLDKLKSLRRS